MNEERIAYNKIKGLVDEVQKTCDLAIELRRLQHQIQTETAELNQSKKYYENMKIEFKKNCDKLRRQKPYGMGLYEYLKSQNLHEHDIGLNPDYLIKE